MAKDKPSASTSPAATTAQPQPQPQAGEATTVPSYLPMRSLLFSSEDQHFYAVAAYTKDNVEGRRDPETDEIIQEEIPANEWEPGARLDPFTFNLVEKKYAMGQVPPQNPSIYENPEFYPTEETTDAITRLVQRTFPGLNFTVVIDPVTGRVDMAVVNPVIQGHSGMFSPGQVAVDIMVNGAKVALEKLAAQLRATVLR